MSYSPDNPLQHTPELPAGHTGGKFIKWVNGRPVPVYAQPLNKNQVSDLITAMMSTQYEGDIDPRTGEPINFDPRFAGMTNAEVMAFRLVQKAANGEDKAITEILDRILGKPKQSVESVGVKMNYRDFLEMLEKDEAAQQQVEFETSVIDVDSHPIYDEDDDDSWLD